jgi:sialate O-acetylesterase
MEDYELFKKDPDALLKLQKERAREKKQKEPEKVQNPLHANSPAALYNGMIHPLLNYTVKGAIWYQGESNAGQAYRYRALFPMMIKNWRDDFKNPDLTFLFVQLAPFTAVNKDPGESNWAELREAQTMTLKLPHTGQAVITDLGDEVDIHPTPKLPVGERLALIARAKDYGEKIEYSGPMYKEMKIEGNKAVLSFDHGDGLTMKNVVLVPRDRHKEWRVQDGSAKELMGFTMCGEDKKFYPAKAEIVGDKVVVTCDAVTKPVAVRYGWAQHPVCNLYNKAGLPASPFRTDDFPGITVPKKQ